MQFSQILNPLYSSNAYHTWYKWTWKKMAMDIFMLFFLSRKTSLDTVWNCSLIFQNYYEKKKQISAIRKNWQKILAAFEVDFVIFDPKKIIIFYRSQMNFWNPFQGKKKWLDHLLVGMFMDKVKNFCNHSMILWELADGLLTNGWIPPPTPLEL